MKYLPAFLCFLIVGCASKSDRPISTSLRDLQAESDPIKGPVLSHHEVFSISGLLPIPETGHFFHYPSGRRTSIFSPLGFTKTLPPSSAIGISGTRSFRAIGTSSPDITEAAANNVLSAFEKANQEAAKAAIASADLRKVKMLKAAILQRIQKTLSAKEREKEIEDLKVYLTAAKVDLPKVPVGKDELKVLRKKQLEYIETVIDSKALDFKKLDDLAQKGLQNFKTLRAQPGIIIANWSIDSKRSFGLNLDPVASGESNKSKKQNGFIILAGIRIEHIQLGDDYRHMIMNLPKGVRKTFKYTGITTYVMQARHVRFISGIDIAEELRMRLEVERSMFADASALYESLENLSMRYYSSIIGQMVNQGSVSDMTWESEPIQLGVQWKDNFGVKPAEKDLFLDKWATVHAVISSGDRLLDLWEPGIVRSRQRKIQLPLEIYASVVGKEKKKGSVLKEVMLLNKFLEEDFVYTGVEEFYLAVEQLYEALDDFIKIADSSSLQGVDVQNFEDCLRKVNALLKKHNGWQGLAFDRLARYSSEALEECANGESESRTVSELLIEAASILNAVTLSGT